MRDSLKYGVRSRVNIPIGNHLAEFISFRGLADEKEHIAISFAGPKNRTPLVRVHSECLTGDVFSSRRCDCGEQLHEAIEIFAQHGGVLLYLRQEGRGIGLYNKLDAYKLQLMGKDTYEANRCLGLPDDARDYRVAAQMLLALNINQVRLLSNNPQKAAGLAIHGIGIVEQVSTGVFVQSDNVNYLKTKADKTGHLISHRILDLELSKTGSEA